ncbi:hypothetical protein [Arthrobacter bambusae]|uniref:Cytoskeletal protein RodZ n=1 Tax=Arthrobacter bambusae TaxID=1338426 RepID=A0AAW8DHE5_9MICC|nr:hypothetical protein [Arthrobacter bambusae]MDP9904825.1 cytoskeletal protein RodZ [Arthrobacter bambusae]MDQ0129641.1 cytoskeletal protein RodZ [Arthrobacter bambusae]MDQ0180746.1 cytoskeletal protein RodZ [Arthrobacter bambusae]MDQ0238891.1 cytoskeletal protein RodZ [Arthrobacter bambusae]
MRRAAKAGIVVAGVVAVGLAGAITLNATQTSSTSIAGAPPSATVSAAASAPGPTKTPATTPSATASASAAGASASASASAAPSSQAPVPAPPTSAKPDAPEPAPAAPAPAPAVPAPVQQGLDAAGIQRIKDSCSARLQSDAAHSSIVTGTVVPRPFSVVSIAFSGNPVQSTAASGLASYDILMKVTLKLVDGPAQDSVRVCRVYDSDSHVDWLPAG